VSTCWCGTFGCAGDHPTKAQFEALDPEKLRKDLAALEVEHKALRESLATAHARAEALEKERDALRKALREALGE
jgi:uncharacterized protein involved in exopolysaccharide biosynthesis